MNSGQILSEVSQQKWFRLEQLVSAVLADAVSADANFQLVQANAWRDFSRSLAELKQLPPTEDTDITPGYGCMQYLGVSELSITLPLQIYRPNIWLRGWHALKRLFGTKPPPNEEKFRLARHDSQTTIQLSITAVRDNAGRWQMQQQRH